MSRNSDRERIAKDAVRGGPTNSPASKPWQPPPRDPGEGDNRYGSRASKPEQEAVRQQRVGGQ